MSATITNLYLLEVDGQSLGQFTRAKLISINRAINHILLPNSTEGAQVVIDAVCQHFGITQKQISGPGRQLSSTWPRQICMALLRAHTELTFERIGSIFSRDHGTAIHACETVADREATEPQTRADLAAIRLLIAAAEENKNGDPKATP